MWTTLNIATPRKDREHDGPLAMANRPPAIALGVRLQASGPTACCIARDLRIGCRSPPRDTYEDGSPKVSLCFQVEVQAKGASSRSAKTDYPPCPADERPQVKSRPEKLTS
jgi:hypothetical protein